MPLRPILKALPPPLPLHESLSGDDFTQELKLSPTHLNNPLPFACLSHIPPLDSPHVHFPPTPTLTRTEMTHSRLSYDRKPISVSPNLCALPGRGERTLDYFHIRQPHKPRSYEFEEGFPSSPTTGLKSGKPFERRRCLSTNSRIVMKAPSPPESNHATGASTSPDHTNSNRRRSLKSSQGIEVDLYPTQWNAPPALVFESPSGSESDACISPPEDLNPLPPSLPHLSIYSCGVLSANGQNKAKHTSLSYRDHHSKFSASGDKVSLNFGEQMMREYRQWESKCNRKPTNSKLEEGNFGGAKSSNEVTTGPIRKSRTRTRYRLTDTRAGPESSNFLEPGLDGCLGGF